ncbi:MAG: hypothetical protein NZO58_01130, partial [Gemmataceae bacterium]|nr:hypothetical protein [Gemmataceae bacterium]
MRRRTVAVFAVAFLGVFGLPQLEAQDDLARILERDRIIAQKLIADANDALIQSRQLERYDPNRAMERLLEITLKIKNASELPESERSRLLERLQTRQRELIAAKQAKRLADDEAAALRAEQKARNDARTGRDQGSKTTVSQGPAAVASQYIEQRNAQLAAVNKQKAEANERNLNTLAGLQRGAVPIDGDIQFSKDWARISERGKPKLTEKEIAMLRALNSTLSVNFDKLPFSEVINQLQNKAGISIVMDEASVREVNLDYSDPVTLNVNKATLRIILQKVLKDRGLTYVLKDGLVQVVTLEKARQMMVVRAYPVQDLVAPDNPLFWGPIFSRAIMLQNAQRLIDMITSSI